MASSKAAGLEPPDISAIRAGLESRVDALACVLLGEPNKSLSTARELRFGSKGAVSVVIAGAKTGSWFDHSASVGGGPFDLIMHAEGTDFRGALAFATSWLGDLGSITPRNRPSADERAAEQGKADRAAIERARWIASRAGPISGTTAAVYIESRGLDSEISTRCVGATSSAAVFVATGTDSAVWAVQLVKLSATGRKRGRKVTFGRMAGTGAAVRFGDDSGPLRYVCEGPEKALAIWQATGVPTYATLGVGNFKNFRAPPRVELVFAADPDVPGCQAWGTVEAAAEVQRGRGHRVTIIRPPADAGDWDNILVADGPERIRALLAAGDTNLATVPIGEGRQHLQAAINGFFGAATYETPEATAPIANMVRVTMGGGKSASALQSIRAYLADDSKRCVVYAVPRHELGVELAERARAVGLEPAIWRGLDADDPEQPGKAMCLRPDISSAATAASVRLRDVCEKVCPKRNECGYRRQRGQTSRLWLTAHHSLFGSKPAPIPTPTALVIDENFAAAGLVLDSKLAISTLQGSVLDVPQPDTREVLRDLRARLRNALTSNGAGPVTRQALDACGLTTEMCRVAHRLEWSRKPEFKPGSDPSPTAVIALLRALASGFTSKVPGLWNLCAELLDGEQDSSPRIEIEIEGALDNGNGSGDLVLMSYRRDINATWGAPTLVLDAIGRAEVVEAFFPHLAVTADIEMAAPHQHVTHVTDCAFSKAMFVGTASATGRRNQSRENNIERLARFIEVKSWFFRSVLVVAQQAVEDLLRDRGLPPNVQLRHHNDIDGEDSYGDVDCAIVVGRTLPNAKTVEHLTGVLTGRHPETVDGSRWPKVAVELHMADGSRQTVQAPRHPDPMVEALRWTMAEGGVLNALGRARGVNRTAANPVEIFLLTDLPLPLMVDRVATWAEVQPSRFEVAFARGDGVLPLSATELARCHPDLWPTANAANCELKRNLESPNFNRVKRLYVSLIDIRPYLICEYRRPGQRGKASKSAIIADGDPRERLSRVVGPLTRFEIIEVHGEPDRDDSVVGADTVIDQNRGTVTVFPAADEPGLWAGRISSGNGMAITTPAAPRAEIIAALVEAVAVPPP